MRFLLLLLVYFFLAFFFISLYSFSLQGRVEICRVVADAPGQEPYGELIEVCNKGGKSVDLAGWSLSDGEGEYVFPKGSILKPGDSKKIYGKEYNPSGETQALFLANKKECVRLTDCNGVLVDEKCW